MTARNNDCLLPTQLACLEDHVRRGLEHWLAGDRWRAKLTVMAVLLALFMSFPSLDVALQGEFKQEWEGLDRQFEHPLSPRGYGATTRQADMEFRLTVPIVVHLLGLGRPGAVMIYLLSGVVLLHLTGSLTFAASRDRSLTAFWVLAAASTCTGSAAFYDHRGIFDCTALALLLGAMLAHSTFLVAFLVFLAAYTDERALLAAGFVALFHVFAGSAAAHKSVRSLVRSPQVGVVGAWGAYVVSAGLLRHFFDLRTPIGDTLALAPRLFLHQVHSLPVATWTALEGLWLPVLAATGVMFLGGRLLFGLTYAGTICAVLLVANSVFDVSRSAGYLFPAVFVAGSVLFRLECRRIVWVTSIVACGTCLMAPNLYVSGTTVHWCLPLPLQLGRMFLTLLRN